MTARTYVDHFDAHRRPFVIADVPTDTAADIELQSAAAEKWHAEHDLPPTDADERDRDRRHTDLLEEKYR